MMQDVSSPSPPGTGRRCLSLWLPHLATDRVHRRERARGPEPAQAQALALVAKVKGALRLSAVDAMARALGLRSGQSLADARALHPALRVADADPAADAALIAAVADWARRYTPLAALDGADGVVLDITGAAHLFGGEAALMADMLARLEAQGFSAPAVAIAGTPEAAWALARFAPAAARLCPPGAEARWLRPLPVAALGLAPELVAGLTVAGLRRVEDLWLRPRAPIAARFGRDVIARLEAAFGQTRSAIAPRLEAPPYVTERRYFDPIMTLEAVTRGVVRLSAEMAMLLERHGEGARRLEVTLFRVDGTVFRIVAGASRPTRDAGAMAALFQDRLTHQADERDVAFGFDVVRLSVLEAVRLDQAAISLDVRAGEREDLARLVDRLGARLGEEAVRRLVALDAHLPEAAAGSLPAQAAEDQPSGARRVMPCWAPTQGIGEPPDRPILLLDRPEPIETLAGLPDGPPTRFRWRRVLHDVTQVEGPERLAAPWWDKAAEPDDEAQTSTRDYFRAEDRQGRRFWLYREGLNRVPEPGLPGRPATENALAPRWFVHGLFG